MGFVRPIFYKFFTFLYLLLRLFCILQLFSFQLLFIGFYSIHIYFFILADLCPHRRLSLFVFTVSTSSWISGPRTSGPHILHGDQVGI